MAWRCRDSPKGSLNSAVTGPITNWPRFPERKWYSYRLVPPAADLAGNRNTGDSPNRAGRRSSMRAWPEPIPVRATASRTVVVAAVSTLAGLNSR